MCHSSIKRACCDIPTAVRDVGGASGPNPLEACALCFCPEECAPLTPTSAIVEEGASYGPHPVAPLLLPRRSPGSPWGQ